MEEEEGEEEEEDIKVQRWQNCKTLPVAAHIRFRIYINHQWIPYCHLNLLHPNTH